MGAMVGQHDTQEGLPSPWRFCGLFPMQHPLTILHTAQCNGHDHPLPDEVLLPSQTVRFGVDLLEVLYCTAARKSRISASFTDHPHHPIQPAASSCPPWP
jgi:hypothetical protein